MANQVPPASQPSNPHPKPTRRDITPIIVALIGLTGTLITVMMSSPLIVRFYDRRMATQAAQTQAMTATFLTPSITVIAQATSTTIALQPSSTATSELVEFTATFISEASNETPVVDEHTATSPPLTDTSETISDTPQVSETVIGSPFPEGVVSDRWDEGYYLTSLAYGDDEWALIFSQDTGYTTQGWNIVDSEPEAVIEQRWKDGFDLTSLAYSPEGWVMVFSKGTGYSDQAWRRDDQFPVSTIRSRWDEGFSISALAYGNGEWCVVFSEISAITDQSWKLDKTFPTDAIRKEWEDGASITSLAFGADQWAVVFSEGSGLSAQAWVHDAAFPEENINVKWSQDKDITSLAYGEGEWTLVFSEGSGLILPRHGIYADSFFRSNTASPVNGASETTYLPPCTRSLGWKRRRIGGKYHSRLKLPSASSRFTVTLPPSGRYTRYSCPTFARQ